MSDSMCSPSVVRFASDFFVSSWQSFCFVVKVSDVQLLVYVTLWLSASLLLVLIFIVFIAERMAALRLGLSANSAAHAHKICVSLSELLFARLGRT